MKMLFDIGNTSINWALEVQNEFIITDHFNFDPANLEYQLDKIILGKNIETPSSILIANVAGEDVFNIVRNWSQRHWQLDLWEAQTSHEFDDLKNGYKNIRELGVDRWLAMIAAWKKYKTDLCVIDCGTALTIDIIEPTGRHLGGYIVPGYELMQSILNDHTRNINVSLNNQLLMTPGKNTRDAVNNGACLGIVSIITRTLHMLEAEFNLKPDCILTGGKAELITPLIKYATIFEPHLVLSGLSILHNRAP